MSDYIDDSPEIDLSATRLSVCQNYRSKKERIKDRHVGSD